MATLFCVSGWVGAQTIESLQWVDGADRPTARISFNANVRFLRQAPAVASDLVQLSFQIITADETVLGQAVEESKRLQAAGPLPGFSLSYVPVSGNRTRTVSLRFTQPVAVVARQGPGAKAIDVVFVSADANGKAPQSLLPPMAESAADRHFAVLLQVSPQGAPVNVPRVPVDLQDYAVFTRNLVEGTEVRSAVAIGYFRTQEDAEEIRQRVLDRFPLASVLHLDALSPAPEPPAPPVVAETIAPANPEAIAKRDQQSADLVKQAREDLAQQRYSEAAEILNRALLLPPNPSSPQAQELIGNAWEGLGQKDKAKLEYQLYLRQYPQGESVKAVTERLAALGGAVVAPAAAAATTAPAAPVLTRSDQAAKQQGFNYTGSISQYYYGGQSRSQSLVNISAGIDQNTLTRTNQSALVTSLDLSGRLKTEGAETRLVLRETNSKNFIASSHAQSVLSAAYVDYRDLSSRLGLRVGRQSAIGGSLFGLFDGVSMTVPVGMKLKFDAMAGVPANTLVTAPSQKLMGFMLEADNLLEHWGGNMSYIEQRTEGISDRRSMGMDVRYFGESLSMYSQIDYDLNFRALNAFTLQGSMQGPADSTITLLADNRKSPALQMSDALISSGTTSLKTLMQLKTLDEIKDIARATAAQARQVMLSISRPLAPKWQGSADLRYSEIGALPAVANFQAQPATGAQYNVSVQLTGSNLYSTRDVNGFNVSQLSSSNLKGTQLAYNNLTGLWNNRASLEPSIRFYTQTDNTATRVVRVSPGVRLSYKVSDRASVLGESIIERSRTDGPSNHDASTSIFFYVGYRYDLF